VISSGHHAFPKDLGEYRPSAGVAITNARPQLRINSQSAPVGKIGMAVLVPPPKPSALVFFRHKVATLDGCLIIIFAFVFSFWEFHFVTWDFFVRNEFEQV
jgi:hypothetical protein